MHVHVNIINVTSAAECNSMMKSLCSLWTGKSTEEQHVGTGIRITGIWCTWVETNDRRNTTILRCVWQVVLSDISTECSSVLLT